MVGKGTATSSGEGRAQCAEEPCPVPRSSGTGSFRFRELESAAAYSDGKQTVGMYYTKMQSTSVSRHMFPAINVIS